jgi:alpha-1,2-mannosyltransferase
MSFGVGKVRFSVLGARLFAFWLLAMALLVIGWWWRPVGLYVPTNQGASPSSAAEAGRPQTRNPAAGTIRERIFERDDSWAAMRAALEQRRDHPDGALYAPVLARCLKFQYPPSSLLALDAMNVVLGARAVSNVVLNSLSFLFLAAFLIATYMLVRPALVPFSQAPLDHFLIFAFALSYYPVLKGLELGQIQTWLSGLFALALLAYVSGRRASVGIALGIIVSIKPQMGVFLLWAVLRREKRMAVAMAATLAGLGLLSLARYGLASHLEYLQLVQLLSRGEAYAPNQSLNGLLLRALHLGSNRDFSCHDFAPNDPIVHAGTLLGSLVLIGLCLFYKREWHANNPGASMGLAGLCFTIASPIAWEHHYGILPPVFAVCFATLVSQAGVHRRWKWLALGAAWLASVRFAAMGMLSGTSFNFLQSHLFFGGLTLIVLLHTLRQPHATSAATKS